MMIQRHRRVAIYTRVSTDGQTCANQENELRAVAERKGCAAWCRPWSSTPRSIAFFVSGDFASVFSQMRYGFRVGRNYAD
jgi:DNA invertase Pin-like site-specific DNA recombinase